MPTIEYSREARRELEKLDVVVRRRVEERVQRLADGDLEGKPLRQQWKGLRSVRAGDWRVLYRQGAPEKLEIVTVGHRREVYC